MSNMLEQAIVDAAALKEAALKNADRFLRSTPQKLKVPLTLF